MNTLVIVLIAAVCLFGAYMLYGRWLANKWGIDPSAKTPAVVHEDGRDYVPTDGWTVFAHQFIPPYQSPHGKPALNEERFRLIHLPYKTPNDGLLQNGHEAVLSAYRRALLHPQV